MKNVHEDAGWANRMTLMHRFLMLRKDPETSMQEHLNKFNEYYQALIDVKVDISDMLKVTVLLASLPEDYENIVTAIESLLTLAPPPTPLRGRRSRRRTSTM